ncbi:uncharacterized protein LOC125478436 [Pyrus x bretschneideri]|uniref:uncharacterized protein LOC125478436 n=1 Tax=Pyrus x bretschneideri TaxID=225117 RepID=UPI00202FD67C|nr:uncharacterized protein LOC125478436 [Pyrus x bretschneideri]
MGYETMVDLIVELFKSREELIKWAREVEKVNSFVIVTLRSDQGGKDNRSPRLKLGCERNGHYDEKLVTDDDWILTIVIGVHNHTAADHLEGNSFAGRLSLEETSLLADPAKSLVQPKDFD